MIKTEGPPPVSPESPPTTMMSAAGRMFSNNEKHEIKKSSYYVWFLGAKESKGLRGEDYITPVVRYLIGKEREQAPIKVTLQLSNKGLKIIQNVSGKRVHENYRVRLNCPYNNYTFLLVMLQRCFVPTYCILKIQCKLNLNELL